MKVPVRDLQDLLSACNEHIMALDDLVVRRVHSADYIKKVFLEKKDALFKDLSQKDEKQITRQLMQLFPNARDLDGVGFSMSEHPEYRRTLFLITEELNEIIDQ